METRVGLITRKKMPFIMLLYEVMNTYGPVSESGLSSSHRLST